MRELKGIYRGSLEVEGKSLLIRGMIHGDVRVGAEAVVEVRGMIFGDLLLTAGRVHLRGMVSGDVIQTGGDLRLSGMVKGRVEQTRQGRAA